jgi:hypothetical protein
MNRSTTPRRNSLHRWTRTYSMIKTKETQHLTMRFRRQSSDIFLTAATDYTPARFYRLKSGHAPTGTYLKRFGHREDDKCWWCRSGTLQTREHLFRHCSRWKDQQKALWKAVGKATGWKAGRYRHVQISELFSMEKCDQVVMDFLAATDVGKFPPNLAEERGQEERGQD